MAHMHISMTSSPLKGFIHPFLSYFFYLHNLVLRINGQKQTQIVTKTSYPTTAAFRRVDSEAHLDLDYHARYWWKSSGYALAVLLDKAGYSSHAQYDILKFVKAITPSLGAAYTPGRQRWKSFMTDDHNPIELSWDWRTGGKSPKIRFSIEPVGVHAGTYLDPNNQYAASRLLDSMLQLLPEANMEWLAHFRLRLSGEEATGSVEGHQSKEFYAFDLGEEGVISKAYFFPGFKARATRRSNFDVISDTIRTAPGSSPEKLQALEVFQEYVCDPSSPQLEMDMLAIDLIDPAESRFKIYFRIRDTSFASVRAAMTLGGRVRIPDMERGLEDLRSIYHALLGKGTNQDADDVQLPAKDHRTAGILYNVEFKYGSKSPKVKAYLPVRHYARSEEAVMSAVDVHLRQRGASPLSRVNMVNYRSAMGTIFSREALRARSGLHTYIGCSVEAGGELRLVSYINPRQLKFAHAPEEI
ncbi:aromatic prenyltransferase [Daldinia vernicosa]|uniref:aromatic prenyltransferase n=1 Tax=Daldinia vernicosa TaxID=114800 RepID=UPI002008AC09|nr:aromatic prenyltransferase [Daldinia vernicosa]KAI0847153.1 aromatic prenyltransferase [Daldinia vernicosa]